jgi:hypothetical protein
MKIELPVEIEINDYFLDEIVDCIINENIDIDEILPDALSYFNKKLKDRYISEISEEYFKSIILDRINIYKNNKKNELEILDEEINNLKSKISYKEENEGFKNTEFKSYKEYILFLFKNNKYFYHTRYKEELQKYKNLLKWLEEYREIKKGAKYE